MQKPDGAVEIFLQPGEYYWGDAYTRIRTILGSCVAVTAWHPRFMVGGMTHIMNANKPLKVKEGLDPKYAEDAVKMLLHDINKLGLPFHEYQIKLFGGADMFKFSNQDHLPCYESVGEKNIRVTKQLLKEKGYKIHSEHIRGEEHRSIVFDIWSGYVWMKNYKD